MKILVSHFGIYKKGGWGRTYFLAKGLADLGNDVVLLTTRPTISLIIKREILDGVKTIIFPDIIGTKFTSKGYGFLSLLLKIIYSGFNKFDIVHSDVGHRPSSGVPCRINKKIYSSTYVAEWWDLFGKGGQFDNKSWFYKIVFGKYELAYEIKDKESADGIVVLSEFLKQKALKILPEDRIAKIHGGANIENISFILDNSSVKKKYNISNDCVTFGYLDAYDKTLSEIKPFIDAINEIKETINVKIIIYGIHISDETKKKLSLENTLINFGWINFPEDAEKFACTDVFFMIKENNLINNAGWPNKIGEFMACGRPILLNPVGDVIQFVNNHPEGFFLTQPSKNAIMNTILNIIKHKDKIPNLGKLNRKIAENELSWYSRSKLLLSFYKKLINLNETTYPTT